MKIEHIHNACCIVYSSKGTRVLCDPWLHDGGFIGSWALAYKPHLSPVYKIDYDLIYLSHVHPDHFDITFLNKLDRKIPIIIPNEKPINILSEKLSMMGFMNVIPLENEESYSINDINFTMFLPFQKQRFNQDYSLVNFIDSALLIDDGHNSFLNTNDNFPTIEAIKNIEEKFVVPDILSLLYNSAGFYPQCVDNLNKEYKRKEKIKVLKNCFDKLLEISKVSNSKYIMPFAGDYILQGSLSSLNEFLPISTPTEACKFLQSKGIPSLSIGGGGIFSLRANKFLKSGFQYTIKDAMNFAKDKMKVKYPYQTDKVTPFSEITSNMEKATKNFREKLKIFNVYPNYVVRFLSTNGVLMGEIDCSKEGCNEVMTCTLDEALFAGILKKVYHWDNAQTGCHIKFDRSDHPNFSAELHTLLSFLHI